VIPARSFVASASASALCGASRLFEPLKVPQFATPLAMPAGILKRASSKFSRASADDGDVASGGHARALAGSSRRSGKEPVSGDAVAEPETQTIEYENFHSRVDAVFKSLDAGVPATRESGQASTREAGEPWRPRSTSVLRRGANVEGDGCEDEDDETEDEADDGEGTSAGVSVCGRNRNAERRTYRDDLDCLESDEEGDDDQKKMGRLRESVGRCKRLDKEDDFDANDLMAMGASVYDEESDPARNKRVRFDAAERDLPRPVPAHVSHPERFTRYELDEALTVGGGSRGVTPRTSARNELPTTPNIHEEAALPPRETVKPQFSKAAASRARDAKTKTTENDERKRKARDDARGAAAVDASAVEIETLFSAVDAEDGEKARASRQRNARRRERC